MKFLSLLKRSIEIHQFMNINNNILICNLIDAKSVKNMSRMFSKLVEDPNSLCKESIEVYLSLRGV